MNAEKLLKLNEQRENTLFRISNQHCRMVKHLYADFLSSRDRYDAAAAYWEELCNDVLTARGTPDEWKPWLAVNLHRSEVVVEEGAIYSLYSERQNKAISIEQYLPKRDDLELTAGIDHFGEGVLTVPVDYLRICCALSEESAAIAGQLIDAWIKDGTTVADLQELIDRMVRF